MSDGHLRREVLGRQRGLAGPEREGLLLLFLLLCELDIQIDLTCILLLLYVPLDFLVCNRTRRVADRFVVRDRDRLPFLGDLLLPFEAAVCVAQNLVNALGHVGRVLPLFL